MIPCGNPRFAAASQRSDNGLPSLLPLKPGVKRFLDGRCAPTVRSRSTAWSVSTSTSLWWEKAPHDDALGERLEARRRDGPRAEEPACEHVQLPDDARARR